MDKKRGCLWVAGAAVGAIILLVAVMTVVNFDEYETTATSVSTGADVQAVLDALEAARLRLDADDGAAALEAAAAVWSGLPEGEAAWVRAGYAVAATRCQWQPKTAHFWQLKMSHSFGGRGRRAE